MNRARIKTNQSSKAGPATMAKALMALFAVSAAMLSLFLPGIAGTFGGVRYDISVVSVLSTRLYVNGSLLPFSVAAKGFAALLPLLLLAGLALFLMKKHVPSAITFALAMLTALAWMLNVLSIEKAVGALGVSRIGVSLLGAWWLLVTACGLAALLALWARDGETLAHALFLVSACISIGAVVFITVYMFMQGLPGILEIGAKEFLLGREWKPDAKGGGKFGILYMILASFAGTGGAILMGVPVGILTAVFIAELAPAWMVRLMRPAVELLAGIPSVIYGFFGMIVIVPLIRRLFAAQETSGDSLLAVMVILSIMILPTIISVTESALRAVPEAYKEASLALGATHIETIFKVLIPGAKSGILSGVILGVGRAIGETMAITMVAGNAVRLPTLLGSARPLTVGIVFEMGYSSGLHRQALFGIGLVLFVFIMLVNISFTIVSKQGVSLDEK